MFEEKISILREVFPDFRIRKGYEFVTYCPTSRCVSHYGRDKRKLEINLRDDKFACWRCHYKGSPLKLLKEYGNSDKRRRYARAMGISLRQDSQEENRIHLPAEYVFVFDDTRNPTGEKARKYLSDLGASVDSIFQNRVGFCSSGKYNGRIVFPSFDINGDLNYYVTRDLYSNQNFKWLNCNGSMRNTIFNELFVDWSKPIILVESVKAYVKHFENVENMICTNGTKISRKYKLFEQIVLNNTPSVFIAFDAEADKEASIALNEFFEYGVECRMVNFDNQIQPDEISSESFLEAIENASSFSRADLLQNKIRNII